MYEYKIYKSVYEEIINGTKNIEIRLLNDKSEKIKKGDTIKFNVVDSEDYLLVEVLDKFIYNNIDELWKNKEIVLNSTMNYTKEEFTNLLYQIFGQDKVKSSKIVAIKFKLL